MSGDYLPYCDDCLVPLTVRHLLVECPSLRELRQQYLSDCRDSDGFFQLAKVLGEEIYFTSSGIFKFVEEAGFLHQI